MYEVPDKDTINSEILPYLSLAKKELVVKHSSVKALQ
jgi:hypothetical protein